MSYAELHCKTNFSFLEGASHGHELVERAAELGYAALAVTDRNSLAGIVRAHAAAKRVGLKLVVGAEVTPTDALPIVLWAPDRASYGRLSRLITVGRRRATKGKCELTLDDVAQHAEGLLAGIRLPSGPTAQVRSGPRPVEDDSAALPTRTPLEAADKVANSRLSLRESSVCGADSSLSRSERRLSQYSPLGLRLNEIFHDRCYLLAEVHRGPDDVRHLQQLIALSNKTKIPLVAAGDVHYHSPARMPLHDVLTATRHGVTLAAAGGLLFPNAQRHLLPIEDVRAKFAAVPDAVARTIEIADRCQFSLDELRYEYPVELAPDGIAPIDYLKQLSWQGAAQRYPDGVPDKIRRLLEHELQLIAELGYEAFFLTVWDAVRFARSRGILCQGRGSAANSAVCYCLGVTAVDPDKTELLFERFVSKERNEAPDIDVDFEHERREEVLQYLYDKYGRQRAGLAATVITYRARSAIRDVGKALGLSLDRVNLLTKNLDGHPRQTCDLAERVREVGVDPDSEIGTRLIFLVDELIGFPRHLSQHVGGMVITQRPLCELVPIENAAMDGRTVVQWDKDDLEELGILKVDCLSLGMLTAIRKCFEMIQRHSGRKLTLATIPAEDARVYDMVCQADTRGCFQIESRAQMSMLPRLRPRCFYDLVVEIAIVRPGPIQGGMVHPYLRRRAGKEAVTYPNDEIKQVLEKTLGVPVFQEQVMRLAVVAAGFTPGEADQLRRAMGAWQRQGDMERFRLKLLEGMRQRGLNEEFAEQVFQQIRGFGEYGFPESHSASFALLVYASAWLKCYYQAAFTASIINSQPMGFYAPGQLIRDAQRHGVEVRPVDVNHSHWDCTLEDNDALRIGFRLVSGLPAKDVQVVVEEREANGAFRSINDLVRRTGLTRASLDLLAAADAFSSIGESRRSAAWKALAHERRRATRPLIDPTEIDDDSANHLPATSPESEVYEDYATVGLSLRAHPISFHRPTLERIRVRPVKELEQLPNGRIVRVAGIVLLRQRPSTAKGIIFCTLEDETGEANLVFYHQTWERFHRVARHSNAWHVIGKLQREDGVTHVLVHHLSDLSAELTKAEATPATAEQPQAIGDCRIESRDFQ